MRPRHSLRQKDPLTTLILILLVALFLPAQATAQENSAPLSQDAPTAQSALSMPYLSPITANQGIGGSIASGRILDWPESSFPFAFDDFVGVTSGIQAWWSIIGA